MPCVRVFHAKCDCGVCFLVIVKGWLAQPILSLVSFAGPLMTRPTAIGHALQQGTSDGYMGKIFLASMPNSLLLGGLCPQLDAVEQYAQALDSLPNQEIIKLETVDSPRFFFTDGAGADPGHPSTRLCSWAVTKAVENRNQNLLRETALLFGRKQTVYRAKLTAVSLHWL